MPGPRILNVEDNGASRYAKSRILRQAGFEVLEATTGDEALRLVAAWRPQLVTLDVNLPGLSGLEVCRRIKADPATASVLVLHISASAAEPRHRVLGLEGGADGYLAEPVDAEELVATVNALLRLRRAEEALRHREAQLQAILDHSPAVIYMKDLDGRYLLVNRQYERLTRRRLADVQGKSDYDVFQADEAEVFRANDQRVLEAGEPLEFEERVTLDGETRTYLEVKFPVSGAAGRPYAVCAIATDITERKRAEEERARLLARTEAARGEAEAANRAKDEFLATVSHELRTPLDAILGWAQVLRAGKRDDATVARALETIERNARLQAELIADILDAARIITGKLALTLKPVDLAAVVETALDVVRPSAAAKGIALEAALDPAVGPVPGDAARLQQVAWNLLSNAIKFTPIGGVVTVRLGRADGEAVLAVADTGQGIAADFLPFVFDRFRQAEGGTTRAHGGLGLGLAIVRHLVELHGGTVEAESPGPGHGATFRVRLPRLPAVGAVTEARRGPAAASRDPDNPRLPALDAVRVLVVDDEPDARALLSTILEACGAVVTAVASVDDALEALERARPQVIVSDIAMPGQDGYALIRKVRALDPARGGAIPALALTAHAGVEDRQRALGAGFQVHVPKPVEALELTAAVARLAGRVAA